MIVSWSPPWRDRRGRFLPFKAAVLALLFVPGVLCLYWLGTGQLGARPLTEAIHETGLWAIRFLMISLAITPLARALEWNGLLLVRRNVGVAAALYAVAHLGLYVVDENFRLGTVISEIALRFYLTIGFATLLVLIALAWTSTDAWTKKLGRNWKRLHRLVYPFGVVALLHYYIQSKLNVSEPVFVSGLFVWLMAWRLLPESWRRRQGFGVLTALYGSLAIVSALLTAGLEFAWYGLTTRVDPFRVLAANESIARGLRPAHWVLVATVAFAIVVLGRRLTRTPAPARRVPA
ncbi:MAG TPA: protein-methionine-sulfoxide reductase heme-binding subunit MsrQ [Rhodopila sp.]|uniref:sulfite oxidase heme-binding subunit YedZ n=1 Tax=Rhodopila sp. TaxID=2480087 RepID=UPI002C3021C5|nr:protein-methionine-sulfoxide reductase heme-binding subunit MsrQ [Rhodopila sp.]HVY16187.1 protein-methionine-sulfoxide reductase heme-binding subunit MsrQ [Rhodopila sp.]